jgi:hypothetical protein
MSSRVTATTHNLAESGAHGQRRESHAAAALRDERASQLTLHRMTAADEERAFM